MGTAILMRRKSSVPGGEALKFYALFRKLQSHHESSEHTASKRSSSVGPARGAGRS